MKCKSILITILLFMSYGELLAVNQHLWIKMLSADMRNNNNNYTIYVHELKKLSNQIEQLMNPGSIYGSTMINAPFEAFQLENFKSLVDSVRLNDSYKEDQGMTQLMVKKSLEILKNPSGYLKKKSVYKNLNLYLEKSKVITNQDEKISMLEQAEHYIEMLLKLSPNDAELASYRKSIQELSQKNTNIKKSSEKIKNHLPYRAINNEELENDFLKLAKSKNPDMISPMVIIDSSKWVINKNAQGNIISRNRLAVVAYQHKSGNCYLQYYSFQQKYDGSNFGVSYIASGEGKYDLNCEAMNSEK